MQVNRYCLLLNAADRATDLLEKRKYCLLLVPDSCIWNVIYNLLALFKAHGAFICYSHEQEDGIKCANNK